MIMKHNYNCETQKQLLKKGYIKQNKLRKMLTLFHWISDVEFAVNIIITMLVNIRILICPHFVNKIVYKGLLS